MLALLSDITKEDSLGIEGNAIVRDIVGVEFVMKRNQVLRVLYGAGAVEALGKNQVFARWLQKNEVITDYSSVQYLAQGGYGPDRQ